MIKVGIAGYGNLGKGTEKAVQAAEDMELFGIFTRRDPESLQPVSGCPVYPLADAEKYKDDIDVMILCGGSATDLPEQTPALARLFNVVDSFDTHARIPEHFANVDAAAKKGGRTAAISIGWDPGLFSLIRALAESILPDGSTYTFWGKGVSQGHSDAVRRIEGVVDARQYTIPVQAALDAVRSGARPELSTREKHTREVFVVAEEGADLDRIENEIKTMPNYFDEYDTTVHFISQEEMKKNHSTLPHGGLVMRSGNTGESHHLMEFSLTLDSNPEFTSSVLTAAARAVVRLNRAGDTGAKTIFDLPASALCAMTPEEMRAHLL